MPRVLHHGVLHGHGRCTRGSGWVLGGYYTGVLPGPNPCQEPYIYPYRSPYTRTGLHIPVQVSISRSQIPISRSQIPIPQSQIPIPQSQTVPKQCQTGPKQCQTGSNRDIPEMYIGITRPFDWVLPHSGTSGTLYPHGMVPENGSWNGQYRTLRLRLVDSRFTMRNVYNQGPV